MADKKDDKKDKKPSGNPAEEGVIIVVIVIVIIAAISRAVSFFTPSGTGGFSNSVVDKITGGPNGWFANTLHFIGVVVSWYVTAATIFSIVTFLAILYVTWLTYQLKVEEKKKGKLAPVATDLPSMQSQKWQKVLTHVNSQNPAEWRLAILEADVMLDEMLRAGGFHGETLGEMLKDIPKGDFKTIDSAWEAHKIRNAIAHEGSGFLLSQRESKRVIELYGTVFKEFAYI